MFVSLLLLVSLQTQRFYEQYEAGLLALEERRYEEAIVFLSEAVQLKPESSARVKLHGVQFKPYFPHYHLASALYLARRFHEARLALDKAFGQREDLDEELAEKMLFLKTTLEEIERLQALPVPAPLAIELGPLMEHLKNKRHADAIQWLNRMKTMDATNAQLYGFLHRMVAEQQTLQRDLENIQMRYQNQRAQDRATALVEARRALDAGNMVEAFSYYKQVQFLEPDHPEASQFLAEYAASAVELDPEAYELALAKVAAMEEDRRKQEDLISDLKRDWQSRFEAVSRILEEQKGQRTPISPSQPVLSLVEIGQLSYRILVEYEGPILLKRAVLSLNGQPLKEWPLMQKTQFKSALEALLRPEENVLQVDVFSEDDSLYAQSQHHFTPPSSSRHKRPVGSHSLGWMLFLFSLLLIASYLLLQLNQRRAFRSRFNPYIAGAPVLDQDMFYGRGPLLRQILNTIHNNSLMVCGERRIGKTSFLHQLLQALPQVEDPTYQFIPVMIDLQGVDEAHFFQHLLHEIACAVAPLGVQTTLGGGPMDGRTFSQKLRGIVEQLVATCPKEPKLALLLDEVDVMNSFSERTNQQLRAVFMKGFAKHLVAIMAGIHLSRRWKSEGSPWYNFFEQIELKPFSRDQAVELITHPVKGVYRFDGEAIEKILTLSGGKPYIIQKLCVNLVAHVLNENRRRIQAEDVEFVYQQIRHEVES
jgi:tetratricopeptide (TPR) repeat protein